eukprot:1659377-Rhodomonas_salina.1
MPILPHGPLLRGCLFIGYYKIGNNATASVLSASKGAFLHSSVAFGWALLRVSLTRLQVYNHLCRFSSLLLVTGKILTNVRTKNFVLLLEHISALSSTGRPSRTPHFFF